MAASEQVLLSLRNVSKTFNGQSALSGVDLEVRRGEVHALLGQNGSGKSTLIKVLAGYHAPDRGATATAAGTNLELGSAAGARAAGIRFIHQDLGLIPGLDVIDNLALGEGYAGRAWLSNRRERRAAAQLLDRFEVNVDAEAPLESLSAAQRSMVAIVRAVASAGADRGLLVLDEPTAALPDHEVRQLFGLVRAVTAEGGGVLYVTHRLAEVFQIADRVSVLRDGRKVADRSVDGLNHDTLVELIIGRPLDTFYPPPPRPAEQVALQANDIAGGAVTSASFALHQGEILGVTGLVGSGYDELLALVFGSRNRAGGTVELDGRQLPPARPSASVQAGVAFVPADRKGSGAILDWTVRENATLSAIPAQGPLRWVSSRHEDASIRGWLDQLDVTPSEPGRLFSSLSGGNQQKVVLARWLRTSPSVLLLEEPTNGVDTGAKQAIYRCLADAAATGTAVALASSDNEELCAVCDRVLVLRDGRVAAVLHGAQLTVEHVLREVLRDDTTPLASASTPTTG